MSKTITVRIIGDPSSLQRGFASASAAAEGFGTKMESVGKRVAGVGHTLTTRISAPLAIIGGLSAKAAIDFQNSMELLHTQAGVGQKAVDALSQSVVALAGPTATAPEELSKGLYHLASQGLRGAQAMDALKVAAEGAKLGQANLEDVTNGLGAVLASGIRGSHNYIQAMGQLNAVVGAGDMRMQDLSDALGTGLPAKAAVAGVSLRDVGAALAVFGDNNIRGAAAGTLLNSTLRLMEGPSHAAAKAMGEFGINAHQLGETLARKGLVPAISLLSDKLKGLDHAQKLAALTPMFGGKQAGGVLILIDQLERLKQKEKAVQEGGKGFGKSWEAYTHTAAYHLAQMGANMQAAGISLGNILLPIISAIANKVSAWAQAFQRLSPIMKDLILIGGGIAIALGPVLSVLGNIAAVLGFIAANPFVLLIAGIALLVAAFVAAVVWPDKLRGVLEKLGLSASQAGTVVADLRLAFEVVKTAVMALVRVVQENWPKISAIIRGVIDVVRTTISAGVSAVKFIWQNFHTEITAIARAEWNYIKSTVKNALTVIKGIVDLVTGLIHGDWGKAWQGVKEILSGTLAQMENRMRLFATIAFQLAKAIGVAIIKGIVALSDLQAKLLTKIENAITGAVSALIGWAAGEGARVGKAMTGGIISGITGAAGGIKDAVTGAISSGVSLAGKVLRGSGDFMFTIHAVGVPLGKGIVTGATTGIGPLGAALSAGIKKATAAALATALAAVQSAKSAFSAAFGTLSSAADAAFDANSAKWKSPEQQQLDAMQAQDTVNQLQRSIDSAQQGLSDARAGGDPQAILAAQQQLDDAQRAQTEYNLSLQAADEQKAHDDQAAADKLRFDAALSALEKHLEKIHASYKKSHEAIIALFAKFHVPYQNAGLELGQQFAVGLQLAMGDVKAAADALARAFANELSVRGGGSGKKNARASGGPVLAGDPYLVGELGPELFVPGNSGRIIPNGALAYAGGGGDIVLHNVMELDGQVIYENQKRIQNRDNLRNGRSL